MYKKRTKGLPFFNFFFLIPREERKRRENKKKKVLFIDTLRAQDYVPTKREKHARRIISDT